MDPFVFGMLAGALAGGCAATAAVACAAARRADERDRHGNPHAHLLGKTVAVKKYQGSEWERCVVICVSWKGAVKVRRLSEMDDMAHGNGFWICKEQAPTRVREIS